jgi:fructose-1,6-bisphosphatase/inositol monophosphatase family enzyme
MRPFELTWVCCGVDYPHLVEGGADVVLYGPPRPWDHAPGGLLLTESGGFIGTLEGEAYDAQGPEQRGILATADRATYDAVLKLLPAPRPA